MLTPVRSGVAVAALGAACVLVSMSAATGAPVRVAPVASLWYRGTPDGVPLQDDLAAIRAVGFTSVAWPIRSARAVPDLQRMAGVVGLAVMLRTDPRPLTIDRSRTPGVQIDVNVKQVPARLMPAVIWRAVAHGARDVAFDPAAEAGPGLGAPGAPVPDWLPVAVGLARQFSANASLFAALTPGPDVVIESPRADTSDVVLLETDRTWVLIATNTASTQARLVSRMPPLVPPALWVSLLDGEAMSMLDEPGGARWTVDLAAGAAAAYVIDKKK
jgi:hypothetical protein